MPVLVTDFFISEAVLFFKGVVVTVFFTTGLVTLLSAPWLTLALYLPTREDFLDEETVLEDATAFFEDTPLTDDRADCVLTVEAEVAEIPVELFDDFREARETTTFFLFTCEVLFSVNVLEALVPTTDLVVAALDEARFPLTPTAFLEEETEDEVVTLFFVAVFDLRFTEAEVKEVTLGTLLADGC